MKIFSRKKAPSANIDSTKGIAKTICEVLQDFDIACRIHKTNIGPKVTQYIIRLDQHNQLTKVIELEVNIALILKSQVVRIVILSEKDRLVSIEVPSQKATTLSASSLMNTAIWQRSRSKSCFMVGQDVYGETILADLAINRHILIAGQTGSGKSTLLYIILASLLTRNTPETLRLILIDPKRVEFFLFNKTPHLQMPIITDPEESKEAFGWLVEESAGREQLLVDNSAISIDQLEPRPPRIVIVCDELSDLMMAYPKDVELTVNKVSNSPYDLGIHFIFSTSRPSANVLTDPLKIAMPTHWALTTNSQYDSESILGITGAEKLLGRGDMLMKNDVDDSLRRVQVAHTSDEEIARIINDVTKDSDK